MTVRLYSSADAGAPQLSGASGDLVAVLDACLVNGYGSKPGAGWTKDYASITLRAAYRQGAGGRGHYFYLDDSGGVAARCCGYESMSSIDAGTGMFPNGQVGLLYMHKHDGAAGTRGWLLLANEATFHFITQYDTQATWVASSFTSFGKIKSFFQNDVFDTMLIAARLATQTSGSGNPNSANATGDIWTQYGSACWLYTLRGDILLPGHYMARRWHGIGSSLNFGKGSTSIIEDSFSVQQMYNVGWNKLGYPSAAYTTPNPPDGSLYISPLTVLESGGIRGTIPGMWNHRFGQFFMQHGDTLDGTGEHAGRRFMAVNGWYGAAFLEISDTW